MTDREKYLLEKEQACGLDKSERYELDQLAKNSKRLSNKIIEVEWLYEDELNEKEHRYSNIISLHTDTALGQAINYCNDKDNFDALNAILSKEFEVVDDDIVFYLTDINDEDDEVIKSELRASNDMVVFGLEVVGEAE